MRKLRLQTRYGNKRKVWKIEKKIYDQGPMNMFDKTYPRQNELLIPISSKWSKLIMVTEPLQNQVAKSSSGKKIKEPCFATCNIICTSLLPAQYRLASKKTLPVISFVIFFFHSNLAIFAVVIAFWLWACTITSRRGFCDKLIHVNVT